MKQNTEYSLPVTRDTIHLPFREAYRRIGETTYQCFADNTGVPLSHISNFMRGSLGKPDVFYLSAMALWINQKLGRVELSLDKLFGIVPSDWVCASSDAAAGRTGQEVSQLTDRIAQLERENTSLADQLNNARHEIAQMKSSAEYNAKIQSLKDDNIAQLQNALRSRRPLIWALLGLDFVMLLILFAYLAIDISAPSIGFFRGEASIFGIAIFAVVTAAVIVLGCFILHELRGSGKK